LVNRTQGTRIASDVLKRHVFEVSLADLQNDTDAERSFRKFNLIAEVHGRNVLCNFHGMDLITDERSIVKKWQTLNECSVDVKTTDVCIGFTINDSVSQHKTCNAQHSQIKKNRRKMTTIITRNVTSSNMKEVVNMLLPDSIVRESTRCTMSTFANLVLLNF
ncbi:AAEL006141-PA, partial [Aedes aegypti]